MWLCAVESEGESEGESNRESEIESERERGGESAHVCLCVYVCNIPMSVYFIKLFQTILPRFDFV